MSTVYDSDQKVCAISCVITLIYLYKDERKERKTNFLSIPKLNLYVHQNMINCKATLPQMRYASEDVKSLLTVRMA